MSALSQPAKRSCLLVRFRHGDPSSPTYERFTDSPDPQQGPDFATYSPLPALNVPSINYGGGFNEELVTLNMSLGASGSFSDYVSNGEPHSPVTVDIWESIEGVPASSGRTFLHLTSGDLQVVSRNVEGNPDVISMQIANLKSQVDVPLGVPMTPDCANTFTVGRCQLSPAGLADSGTLTAKDSSDGMIVTITGLGAQSGRYWHRGYVEVDGLRIGIRDWVDSDPTTFALVVEPPARWVGVAVTVFPGCDKSLDTCRNRWNNEEHFNGLGIAIPAYHPVVESGS